MAINKEFFFDRVRKTLFGGKLSQKQVDGMTEIFYEWETNHWEKDDRWLAYALATTFHETDRTMQPIREYGRGKGKRYGKPHPVTGQVYYGRGDVQLTWYDNYKKMSDVFKVDFVNNPDLVMIPDNAAKIMFHGMEHGSFTGKKFADYFNDEKTDWKNARRIINGLDKANQIAEFAKEFYAAISYTI